MKDRNRLLRIIKHQEIGQLEEINNLLETSNHQDSIKKTEYVNSPIIIRGIRSVIKTLPTQENSSFRWLHG